MRISTAATAVLVLLASTGSYYLGAHRCAVEPDAYGLASRKFAFPNRYDCEVMAVFLKEEIGCEPLTFAQIHKDGFRLLPRDSGCSNTND